MSVDKLVCMPEDAQRFFEWLTKRGGLAVWRDLSNPGRTWTTPALKENGEPMLKQDWRMASTPERIVTDIADVEVRVPKEVKRFHVGVRRSSNGMSFKLTDAASKRVRKEEKAAGPDSWHEFDYMAQDCIIFAPDKKIPLAEFLAQTAPKEGTPA